MFTRVSLCKSATIHKQKQFVSSRLQVDGYINCIIRIETSWLGRISSTFLSWQLHLFMLHTTVFSFGLLAIPQQTTTLHPRNTVTTSKRLNMLPAMFFINQEFIVVYYLSIFSVTAWPSSIRTIR